MRFKSLIAITTLTLALTGCGSEYGPEEISISSKGRIVKKDTDSEISGTFVFEKTSGKSLTVEIDDGLPDGDVEMTDENGNVILSSSFSAKEDQNLSRFNPQFFNALFSEAIGQASARDYLQLFEEFAEYDGDYLEVDRDNQKIEGHYENGEKLGRWKQYCENKQVSSDQTFKKFDDGVIKNIGDDLKFTCAGDVILEANRDKKGRLQGKYIEHHYSAYSLFSKTDNEDGPPKLKYVRHYKDGEFDGLQKEYSRDGVIALENNYKNAVLHGIQKKYDRDGKITIESNYKNSVKDGVENVYSSQQNYTTKEITRWLSEIKNYSNGVLNGQYQKFDSENRSLQSGSYLNDKPVGQWVISNYKYNTKKTHDYTANNFTLDKQKAFKGACRLPASSSANMNWSKNRDASTADCQYYIENGLADINKKIALDIYSNNPSPETFERSTKWTYPVIVAKPNIYSLMKQAGAKTAVADSEGRTRLHYCVSQLRQQSQNPPRCSLEELTEYSKDVNLNSISSIGTAFHELALRHSYNFMSKRRRDALIAQDKEATSILIAQGANLNQTNHAGKTPFMSALDSGNYYFAENAIDSGASIKGVDINGKSVLGHFFTQGNRIKGAKLDDNVVRILAKAIALGLDTNAPAFNGKTIKEISEENNTLFHIQTLKDATAMSSNFKDELKNRPTIDDSAVMSPNEATQVPPVEASQTQQVTTQVQPSSETNNSEPIKNSLTEAPSTNSNVALEQTSNEPVEVIEQALSEAPEAGSAAALLKEQADFLVIQANEHLAKYRLKTPKSNSALGTLEQLKKIDPDNENIPLIREAIGKKYLSLATGKINKGQKSSAQNNLNSAKEFLSDESLISQYQTKINDISTTTNTQSSTVSSNSTSYQQASTTAKFACDPVVKLAGIPLIGGQSLTAQQSLPISADLALRKALPAVQKTYLNVRKSGKKITYEQSTSTKPIKFTLTISSSGNASNIVIKAKTPTGIVIKKSGYKQGFCELLADF